MPARCSEQSKKDTHTHTRTHARTHTHSNTRTHRRTHSNTRTHRRTHRRAGAGVDAWTSARGRGCMGTHARARAPGVG
jgi:hypothetical protein